MPVTIKYYDKYGNEKPAPIYRSKIQSVVVEETKVNNTSLTVIPQERDLIDPRKLIIKEQKPTLIEKFKNAKQQYRQYRKLKNNIGRLIDAWQEIMYNKKMLNEANDTFCLSHIQEEDYGWSCRIYAPWGKELELLDNLRLPIESGLNCVFLHDIPEHKEFAIAKIVYPTRVRHNEKPFYPVRVKPYEFYAGVGIDGKPVIFNISETPHILLAGMQRRGKNGSFDHAMTSWIYSCSEKEIEIYLFQCAKNEMVKYKNCKQVRCYIEGNLDQMEVVLKYILKEMNRRQKLFENMVSKAEGDDNIFKYNKLHPKNPLSYMIITFDEFIELMPSETDIKEIKKQKLRILKLIQSVAQWGGTYGVNYICLHQKPEVKLMPSFIKNMSSIRICFGFEDLVCCAIVLGDGLAKYAHKLPTRKAFYSNDEKNGYLYTTNLKGRIKEFIKDSIRPNHKTVFDTIGEINDVEKIEQEDLDIDEDALEDLEDLDDDDNISFDNCEDIDELLEEISDVNFEELNIDELNFEEDIKEKILEEKTLSDSPNFVPYTPLSNDVIVKDERRMNLSNSEKPRKRSVQ